MIFSIVTPIYNSSEYLCSAIDSVISQTFTDWELILIDDCSEDNSVELIGSYVSVDSRIRLIRLPENSGAAVARNKGIELASGRYIAFLDSDDLWLPNKLETQLQFMQEKNIAFSYSAYEKIDEQGQPLGLIGVPEMVNYNQLLKCCVIGCLTAIYDTHKLGKVYMPLIRKRQDLGLWLRLLKKVDYAYGIQQPLAHYRVRSGSISSNKSNAAKFTWRLYREVEKVNFIKASYYFTHYAVRGVLRTKFPRLARFLGVLQ
ncbi:glycosyltransferase family 2 protein [Thalassolituus sp. C2-1]|uniref:glycosyltransferase family 2 protein n=1 Tax=Venatorbacter sp. C2-1 TaxID=2597518 RepID=UPI001192C8B7|nr:glycosyltransferase family 2 protein [Thalassolituus sp. C2-1]TVV42220.1 glycosyltransferase family 2 protein [Thalassolituus sp. C2-1]